MPAGPAEAGHHEQVQRSGALPRQGSRGLKRRSGLSRSPTSSRCVRRIVRSVSRNTRRSARLAAARANRACRASLVKRVWADMPLDPCNRRDLTRSVAYGWAPGLVWRDYGSRRDHCGLTGHGHRTRRRCRKRLAGPVENAVAVYDVAVMKAGLRAAALRWRRRCSARSGEPIQPRTAWA